MFLSRAGVPWRRNYNPPEYAPAAAPACEFNRLVKTLDRAIQQNRFSERRLLFQGVSDPAWKHKQRAGIVGFFAVDRRDLTV